MGDQWPAMLARPPSSIQYAATAANCQPPTLPTFETNILPTPCQSQPLRVRNNFFPSRHSAVWFPFLIGFGRTSYKAGTSPAAAATSDNCLDFTRFVKKGLNKSAIACQQPLLIVSRSDAKGRKQCKLNLFKKPVAAGGGEKNRTVRLPLTQPSVIYRQ